MKTWTYPSTTIPNEFLNYNDVPNPDTPRTLKFILDERAVFFAAVIIYTLTWSVANTFVLIGAYEERLADYSQREAVNREGITTTPTYSVLKLKVQRPPNPLSLFSAGLETRFGSEY